MTQPGQNAYEFLVDMLHRWDLDALAPEALRLVQDGYTETQIPVLLQETETYKKRFAGNDARRKAGLPVLSPEEYLQSERSYRQVMANAGLPASYYDQPDDFASWIGNDVSPVEVQRRVNEASDALSRLDQNTKDAFREFYGIGEAELAAYVLDANRGRDAIDRVVHGGRIAGAARGYGVNLTREQAERFGAMSSESYVEDSQRFGRLAGLGEKLSSLYAGQDYTSEEAAAEVFGKSTEAERKRKLLTARETGEFAGAGGATTGALKQAPGSY